MAEYGETDQEIVAYLRDNAEGGERYFRSKNIADALGLSSKEVGVRLAKLAESVDELNIEKWSRSRSTTWRVAPDS